MNHLLHSETHQSCLRTGSGHSINAIVPMTGVAKRNVLKLNLVDGELVALLGRAVLKKSGIGQRNLSD